MTTTPEAARFGLHDGQFFAEFCKKNLQWFLNGKSIGFGDLRDRDIIRISTLLIGGETFEGFNEHHGTTWQQSHDLIIVITPNHINFPR